MRQPLARWFSMDLSSLPKDYVQSLLHKMSRSLVPLPFIGKTVVQRTSVYKPNSQSVGSMTRTSAVRVNSKLSPTSCASSRSIGKSILPFLSFRVNRSSVVLQVGVNHEKFDALLSVFLTYFF